MLTKEILQEYLPHNIKMIVDLGKLNPKKAGKTKIVELNEGNLEIAVVYQCRLLLRPMPAWEITKGRALLCHYDWYGLLAKGMAVEKDIFNHLNL